MGPRRNIITRVLTYFMYSVIGAAIVVIGFYDVIWGKSQEKVEEDCTVCSSESYDNEVPLLQNKRTGE